MSTTTTTTTVCDNCKKKIEHGSFWVKFIEGASVAALVDGEMSEEDIRKKYGNIVRVEDICSLKCLLHRADAFFNLKLREE